MGAPSNYDWGMWNYHHPSNDEIDDITDAAALGNDDWWTGNIGKQMSYYPKLVWWPAEPWSSIKAWLDAAFSRGGEPVLMLCNSAVVGRWDNPRNWINNTWTNGSHDTALKALADNIKNYGLDHIIHLRFFWEGNQNVQLRPLPYNPVLHPEAGWYADLKDENGTQVNTPTTFINAWRYIVNMFKSRGATNVKFWFTIGSYGDIKYGSKSILGQMYPEDNSHKCVDVLGYEIYSNGQSTDSYCKDPNITYTYPALAALDSGITKPIIIAEAGCQNKIGNATFKPAWLGNTLNPALIRKAYPRTCGILYWDDISTLGDGTKFDLKDTTADQNAALNCFKIADYKKGATGPYLSATNGGGSSVIPARKYPYTWEQFTLTRVSTGMYNIKTYNGKYISAIPVARTDLAAGTVIADRTVASTWETFTLSRLSDGYYTINTCDGHYLTAENGGESPLVANRAAVGVWEKFGFHKVSTGIYNIWTGNYTAYGTDFSINGVSKMPALDTLT